MFVSIDCIGCLGIYLYIYMKQIFLSPPATTSAWREGHFVPPVLSFCNHLMFCLNGLDVISSYWAFVLLFIRVHMFIKFNLLDTGNTKESSSPFRSRHRRLLCNGCINVIFTTPPTHSH